MLSSHERLYRIALAHLAEVGAVRMQRLLQHVGSAQAIWNSPLEQLSPPLSPAQARKLIAFCQSHSPLDLLAKLENKHIQTLVWEDPEYPAWLAAIYDPPQVLFFQGKRKVWRHLNQAIGMVGTRQATAYGRESAGYFAKTLAQQGIVIVSGLAYGIDAAAHQGALDAHGLTVAVLGAGIDRPGPKGNLALAQRIRESGLLISEFPPGMTAQSWTFRVRNRLVSGLTQAVVVIEAGLKSGTLITVDCANEQGREVFALPGSWQSPQSQGTHQLIQQGARLLQHPREIVTDLGWVWNEENPVSFETMDLTREEAQVYEVLSDGAQPVDSLVSQLEISPPVLLSLLTLLELKGLAEQLPGKLYKRKLN